MPRPQRELDPNGGVLVEFARQLRALRADAGNPKFATMARRTGRSKTALADAASGQHLPRWETVADFVRACEADPAGWEPRWERVRRALAASEAAALPAPGSDPGAASAGRAAPGTDGANASLGGAAGGPDAADESSVGVSEEAGSGPAPGVSSAGPTTRIRRDRGWVPRRRRNVLLVGVAVGLVLGGLAGADITHVLGISVPPVEHGLRVIEVQNKVAIGPGGLVEDRTPAYLSTLPIAYCAEPDHSCKVPGTEMGSGVAIVANCVIHGQRMVNYNLKEAAAQSNPDRADSDLWYRASFPDGRSGYLSEVYLAESDRGGLGLPSCGPTTVAPVAAAR